MKKWKVALIGCGSIADNTYLPRIGEIPEADLVAVCDIIPERAKNYAEKFHVPAWYTSIDELLEKCDFEILMNTTSIPAHHEINMKALRAGKHLYSQKPVGLTVEEVTEQIEAAKKMTAIEFLRRYRPEELVKGECRNEYQLREHDSFKINGETSLWHWKSRDVGGRSALDYLIYVEGMKFVDAVLSLCGESPAYFPDSSQPKQEKEFVLPPAAENKKRVFAYLIRRGISREVIDACVRAGILYESAGYRNAVFVGRDEQETARYAFLRGTYSNSKKPFKAEVTGSDKRFCFWLPPQGNSRKMAVYESAIEAMAHLTLEGTADKHRLSLGGIYAPREGSQARPFKKPLALESFLGRHPEIEEIEICLNNDFAGRWAAEHLEKAYQGKYRMVKNLPEREGFDYGDLAKERYEKLASRQRMMLLR